MAIIKLKNLIVATDNLVTQVLKKIVLNAAMSVYSVFAQWSVGSLLVMIGFFLQLIFGWQTSVFSKTPIQPVAGLIPSILIGIASGPLSQLYLKYVRQRFKKRRKFPKAAKEQLLRGINLTARIEVITLLSVIVSLLLRLF